LLVDNGLTPSFTYQMEHEAAQKKAQEEGHSHDNVDDNDNSVGVDDSIKSQESDDLIKY